MALRNIAPFVAAFFACVTGIRADVNQRFEVDIRLYIDPSIAPKRITEGLKSETESIWRPYGLELHWTEASASAPNGVSLDAIVERRFEGTQQMKRPTVLGRAFVSPDAANLRPVRVSFDATASVLARRTITAGASVIGVVRDRELARALGRVLAHEIGHVLIGAPYHDRQGLMRANFSPEELAESDRRPFRLASGSAGRLERRLRALTGSAHFIRQQVPASPDVGDLRAVATAARETTQRHPGVEALRAEPRPRGARQ